MRAHDHKSRVFYLCCPMLVFAGTALAQPPEPPCNSYFLKKDATLTFKQKSCYFAQNKIVTGSGLFGAAFFGAMAQLQDSPKEWPLGADGFGRRMGTRYAQGLAKSTGAYLAGALNHEDPRPRPMTSTDGAKPSFGRRLGHALLRTVWTARDPGHRDSIALSTIGGCFASGFVGRAWTPDRQNTLGQAFIRTGTAFGGNIANSVFAEFQPDLSGLLGKVMGHRNPKK